MEKKENNKRKKVYRYIIPRSAETVVTSIDWTIANIKDFIKPSLNTKYNQHLFI